MFIMNLIDQSKRVTRGFGLLEIFLAKKRAKIADSLINPEHRKGRILDIGCGSFPYFLKSTLFNEKHGIDGEIIIESFKGESIYLKQINVEKQKIPYPANHFNVVIMLAVFEHINPENLSFVLKEILRVLKKDGIFILTTPTPWSIPILSLLSKIHFISKVEINDHKNAFSSIMIKNILQRTGFSKNKIKSGYFEFFLNMWISAQK